MVRSSVVVALFVLVGCGPAENDEASTWPPPLPSSLPAASPQADAGVPAKDAGTQVDAGTAHPSPDAGGAPHVNVAEQVWLAQEDVWMTGLNLRAGACKNALSWVIAVKRDTGRVQNGTYAETASGFTFTAGGNTLKVRNASGWSGELRVDSVVGDVAAAGFPRGADFIDVSWLWGDGSSGRCSLREKSDRIAGRFSVDGTRYDLDFASTTQTDGTSYYNPQTYSSIDIVIIKRLVTGSLMTLSGDRSVTVRTDSDIAVCAGAGCNGASAALYIHRHSVQLRLNNVAWSLDYKTGYEMETTTSPIKKRWFGTITGPKQGSLQVTPLGTAYTLDVVIGTDRYSTDVASAVEVQ